MDSKNWIGGNWSVPTSSKAEVYNPSNLKEKVGVVNKGSEEDVLKAEQAAKIAQKKWARKTGVERADTLYKIILNEHLLNNTPSSQEVNDVSVDYDNLEI